MKERKHTVPPTVVRERGPLWTRSLNFRTGLFIIIWFLAYLAVNRWVRASQPLDYRDPLYARHLSEQYTRMYGAFYAMICGYAGIVMWHVWAARRNSREGMRGGQMSGTKSGDPK